MSGFLALSWSTAKPAEAAEAATLQRVAEAQGEWAIGLSRPGLAIFQRGPHHLPLREVRGLGYLIGDVFAVESTEPLCLAPSLATSKAMDAARRLSRIAWGAYVALLPDDGELALFRDPSGALNCLSWSRGGVQVITSAETGIPSRLLPAKLALDWGAIAAWIVEPGMVPTTSGLSGLAVTSAGALRRSPAAGGEEIAIWSALEHCNGSGPRTRTDASLVDIVDLALRAALSRHERVVAEVSGGLDSAILAGSLRRQGLEGRISAWLNYFGDRPEGDERRFARSVASRTGVTLTEVAKSPVALTEADFTEVALGLAPALNAVDPIRDRDTAERIEDLNATALLSGQGGDAVFFQMPTPLIAVDALRLQGASAIRPRTIVDVARLSRRSAWAVVGDMTRDLLGRPAVAPARPSLAGAAAHNGAGRVAPWMTGTEAVPPAKRHQIMALSHAQLYRGRSRRSEAGELLYPMLSQPVIEHCLGLSSVELTEGGRERGLARRLFADRLPEAVATRRSKGDLTALYSRTLALSLDYLRPLLLDGVLCASGLLDRRELESVLSTDTLIWQGRSGPVFIAALVETWVRHWQGQVPDAADSPRPTALKAG